MTRSPDDTPSRWWEGSVIYQIYPRSFADSGGDGIGDLRGIIGRLDHLRGTDASLGVDAVWLSPIYPSPLADMGYDVADYTDVAPEYGTLDDFDALVDACHARGMKLLLDLVPCHTSVEHPWFVESRSSRQSARRDWYVWADPAPGGGAPNNWESVFGGSAWELESATGQFYCHTFYREQPNLNWRNPAVADAMADAMRFWFRRGVDGFRVDAIQAAVVDEELRDNPPFRRQPSVPGLGPGREQAWLWNVDRPEVHDVVRGLRRVADEFDGRILVGELYAPVERIAGYVGGTADEQFHLAFNFEMLLAAWGQAELTLAIERAEALHPPDALPTYALSNHDQPRHATRWGRARAPVAAVMLLTLRGVSTLYMGEEIGMIDHPKLPRGRRFDRAGRDAQRTPMQWEPGPRGGFTTGTPWLPTVDPERANVAEQRDRPGSLLDLYRRLIALRRESAALRRGTHRSIFGVAPDVLAWTRTADEERVAVVCNLAEEPRTADLSRVASSGAVLLSTVERGGDVDLRRLALAGLEGLVLRLPTAAS